MPLPTTRAWRLTPAKRALIALARPVFLLLSRPSMRWFGDAVYDFALRCNGIAINFPGAHGLTIGEERFISTHLSGKPPGILFDIGANHGAYALYLNQVSPASVIHAFEPHPATFAILRDRLQSFPNIHLVQQAVSDAPGLLKLYDFADSDGSTQASLDENAVRLFSENTVAHDVDVTTIDAYMAEYGIDRIDLLKIDTEGFDLAVLRGATAALAASRIGAIHFEFIPANIARHITMRDFFEVLHGYRLFRQCMNGGLTPLDPYDVKRCEIYITQNLVALPRQRGYNPRIKATPDITPA